MPQPSLGFSPFEALLLVGVAAASRLRSAPLRLESQGVMSRSTRPRPFTPGFTDVRASRETRWPAPHRSSERRFLRAVSPPRGLPDAPDRVRPDRAGTSPASSASKPCSPHEAVPRRRRSGVHGRCSPGLAPLQSLAPIEPRTLRPDGPFRPPRASSRDDEGGDPSPPGEASRPRGRATSSASPCAERPRTEPCRLSAAASPSHGLGPRRANAPGAWPSEA